MTNENRTLAQGITRKMGMGWSLKIENYGREIYTMEHTDGRRVDLFFADGRVSASGAFPVTERSIKHVSTSAAVGRGAAAIAKQIDGPRFMPIYAERLADVQEYNARQERRKSERKRIFETLRQYIPERFHRSTHRPTIDVKQAYERTGDEGWSFTDNNRVNLKFSDLTEDDARMIMRAYSITVGHTPEFLRRVA